MVDVLQEAVGESSAKALEERKERPAFQPNIQLPEDQAEVERMVSGASDLEYTMSFEVLPKIELVDLKSITLEKEVAEPSPEDIEGALDRLLKSNVSYEAKEGEAEIGDRLTIDYIGRIDGEIFEGGSGEDAYIILGSGRFIPGFEEGLIGAKAGEKRNVRVTFPEDYQAKHLAGKEAVFEVEVKEVKRPVEAARDDEFAKSLGFESFSKLEEAIRAQLQKELDTASRNRLKKALLDVLNERHSFEMPPTLVNGEFEAVWKNVTARLAQAGSSFEDQGTSEEKAREEYRALAERRVRLGLILAEIGNRNEIRVSEEELRRAVIDRARQFPGQERQVLEFYKKNPDALNDLRAPVYEEKVINFALELVKTNEKKVTPAELIALAAQSDERDDRLDAHEAHDHGDDDHHHHDHVHGPDCDHDH
jgi:trigger factor